MRVYRLLVTLAVVFAATGAQLASAASITGKVLTSEGSEIPGARVTLFDPDTSVVLERRTDGSGDYAFHGVTEGDWHIGASAGGRAYAEVVVTVGNGMIVEAENFSLGPDVHPGRWSKIGSTEPENIHATGSGSLLPDGRLMYCHSTLDALIFDPRSGAQFWAAESQGRQGCHITTLLLDGRLIYIGGAHTGNPNHAIRAVKAYDPIENSWEVLPSLIEERWYPGLARLADGRLLVMGGGQTTPPHTSIISPQPVVLDSTPRTATCEIYDPQQETWTATDSMAIHYDYTPAVLLYNGLVLRSWWPPELYDPAMGEWRRTGDMVHGDRWYITLLQFEAVDHSLFLLPDGRACAVGVYPYGNAGASMIEIYDPATETWSLGADAPVTRSSANCIMLPTAQIFVAGGRLEEPLGTVPTNQHRQVKLTDIYDPATDTWRQCQDMAWFREYHAVESLIPDGRVVLTSGTGGRGDLGVSNDVDAFEPPYLFRGIRPRIDALSTTDLLNGESFTIDVSRTEAVTSVVLTGTDATTHWVNGGVPRVLPLPFKQAGQTLTVTVPANHNVAPWGYYILWVLVDDIPSEGIVVRVVPTWLLHRGGVTRDPLSTRVRPSPFRESVLFEWNQPEEGPAQVSVHDLQGRLISMDGPRVVPAGWSRFVWTGRDAADHDAGPGVFFVRVRTDQREAVRKVVRVP